MILSIFILLSLVKSRMNVIKYTIRGERIKVKGFRKKCMHMAMICTGAISFVCFQLPFVSYNGQFFLHRGTLHCIHHAHNLCIEEDGSCWINWDKSQLRPQRVFKKTTRNYKDLEESCWTRLLERKMLNESQLFDSLNAWFQNNSSLGPNG